MLRKRTRSHSKEQTMISGATSDSYFSSDILTQKQKTNSFLKVPGLFVGFNPRSTDADSVRSPTSPLDLRIFSGFGNPFRHQHTRSQNDAPQMSWNHAKVGLSIIHSLDNDDETKEPVGKVIWASDNKNIILKRQLSVRRLDFGSHANSLEAPIAAVDAQKGSSDVLFEIGKPSMIDGDFRSRSVDSGKCRSYLTDFGTRKSRFGSGNSVLESCSKNITDENNTSAGKLSSILPCIGPVPVSEIEDSEDYTCVRTHGPNPKVTHIFGDQVLECLNDEVTGILMKIGDADKTAEAGFGPSDDVRVSYQSNGFLEFCYNCKKTLDGEDIYIYRGEKAFCSATCRSHEIEKEEHMEETNNDSSGTFDCSSIGPEATSKSCLFIAT